MPDLPTLQEQGLKGFECYTWNAILAPAGTPQSIVDKLSDAIAKSLADPVVFKRMQEAGVDPTPGMSSAKTAAFIKVELAKWDGDHQGGPARRSTERSRVPDAVQREARRRGTVHR